MTLAEEITVQKNVSAEMRDGTTLVTDVYRPAENGEYPVLLTRLPYGKDQSINPEYMNPIKAAQHGYIVILQDVRGRFDSEGAWYPFVNEFEDGYDAVEWTAGLPGSNGKVGMYGASYPGMTQWQAAVMRPPALKVNRYPFRFYKQVGGEIPRPTARRRARGTLRAGDGGLE